ncbi:UV DNA damage repair endonuclease UvsE [Mesobacillus zeae]|uniref:UV DNA damage repair endonuclease UvsE n=1 Tax=Mesobacillus zeae TaxID=1917180 RepID=A0A398B498_9BACI|nr:UV DNA damage repair endonuclease UvsE [Mesobacillus zeae]RID84244.1 UV DNA damage repair endonuclease UvsE [Mesobacillus zeae]
MTIVKLGYVAMSMHLQNASPSKTMTYKQFEQIADREAAIRKLERISVTNLNNCLRLLKHNELNEIEFFRFSSKLIPLANHEALPGWNYIKPLAEPLKEIADYLKAHPMRVDFHPDHFVLLNTTKTDVLKMSVKTLAMHRRLLIGMGVDTEHRCVLHVGGAYADKEKALEMFIENWALIPLPIQRMIMLENDDKSFTMNDTLYLCEKLGIPHVFDYHHHLANPGLENWEEHWKRTAATWENSPLPVKMHISSPRSEKDFRAHADYIDTRMFMDFLNAIKGSVPEIHCMIEAKQKDASLFRLAEELEGEAGVERLGKVKFLLK